MHIFTVYELFPYLPAAVLRQIAPALKGSDRADLQQVATGAEASAMIHETKETLYLRIATMRADR